jgi:large subunit ribosomal protein L22
MHATAKLSQYRQAPRKVRLVANLVRGKSVADALLELNNRAKRAAPVFAKLINSGVANAKAQGMDVSLLRIGEIRVDKGAVLKRSRPRAQGRAFPIHKHTSHIMITLIDTAPSYATKSAAKTEKKAEASTEKKTVATKTITKKKAAPKASK